MTIQWDRIITAETREAAALTQAKATAHAALAARIAAARSALITDLPGQQMIYLAKEAEARAFLADPAPDLAAYPLLAAEVGLTAPDPAALAQIWLNMALLWRNAAAALEATRLAQGAAIDAATTVAEVRAVGDGFASSNW